MVKSYDATKIPQNLQIRLTKLWQVLKVYNSYQWKHKSSRSVRTIFLAYKFCVKLLRRFELLMFENIHYRKI